MTPQEVVCRASRSPVQAQGWGLGRRLASWVAIRRACNGGRRWSSGTSPSCVEGLVLWEKGTVTPGSTRGNGRPWLLLVFRGHPDAHRPRGRSARWPMRTTRRRGRCQRTGRTSGSSVPVGAPCPGDQGSGWSRLLVKTLSIIIIIKYNSNKYYRLLINCIWLYLFKLEKQK